MPRPFDVDKAFNSIVRNDHRLIDGIAFSGKEFTGWELLKSKQKSEEAEGIRLGTYIWADKSDPLNKRIKLEILEGRDIDKAGDLLKMVLDQLMSSHLLSNDSQGTLGDLGDLSLFNPEKLLENQMLDFLAVVNANVAYRLTSIGETKIPVIGLALDIQAFLLKGTNPITVGTRYQLGFSAEKNILKVGESVELKYGRQHAPDTTNFYCLVATPPHCRIYRKMGKVYLEGKIPGPVNVTLFNLDHESGHSRENLEFKILP